MYLSYVIYGLRQGNPFSSYGENLVISIQVTCVRYTHLLEALWLNSFVFKIWQNMILVALLWSFMKQRPSFGHMVGVVAMLVAFVVGSYNLPDEWQVSVLQIYSLMSPPHTPTIYVFVCAVHLAVRQLCPADVFTGATNLQQFYSQGYWYVNSCVCLRTCTCLQNPLSDYLPALLIA